MPTQLCRVVNSRPEGAATRLHCAVESASVLGLAGKAPSFRPKASPDLYHSQTSSLLNSCIGPHRLVAADVARAPVIQPEASLSTAWEPPARKMGQPRRPAAGPPTAATPVGPGWRQ